MRKERPVYLSAAAKERLLSALSPLTLLLIWQMMSDGGLIDPRFVPSPLSIAVAAYDLTITGELMLHIRTSLVRLAAGFAIGASIGVAVGLAMGLSRWTRAVIDPIVSAIYPIPKIALLPLIMLFLGIGEASKITVVAISVVFIVIINTMAGVLTLDPIYFDVAKNYRTPWHKLFTRVVLPGALPAIFVGLRLAIGVALILIVAAEFVAANAGIGFLIWSSFDVFRVENMFVGIIVITVLGVVSTLILRELERWIIPHRERT